jgi:hypothetical protein
MTNDFDFLFGRWTVNHRRLRVRGCGCTEWDEFTGTAETRPLLDGLCNIEEHRIAEQSFSGIALRAFDRRTKLWSIYWVGEERGRLEPPVIGAFEGDLGRFEGADVDSGSVVAVRFLWDRAKPDAPRWEQSFSYDQGESWELNWVMQFQRS